jgi:hypothetical protein
MPSAKQAKNGEVHPAAVRTERQDIPVVHCPAHSTATKAPPRAREVAIETVTLGQSLPAAQSADQEAHSNPQKGEASQPNPNESKGVVIRKLLQYQPLGFMF